MWKGDYSFLLWNLVQKDFKIRYRNMSLGMLWSLLNPLVMMGVLTFIFTVIFPNPRPHFAVFVLCGLVPFNFFSMAFVYGTSSLVDNTNMIKRVPIPRVVIPLAAVLANCLHLAIQIGLLLFLVLLFGYRPNIYWLWLPVVWGLEIAFVCGLSLITAPLTVYIRDTRYLVESANTILFWLVPIMYDFKNVPARFSDLYILNPVAALVLILRTILLEGKAPLSTTLVKLALGSLFMLTIGFIFFWRARRSLYDRL